LFTLKTRKNGLDFRQVYKNLEGFALAIKRTAISLAGSTKEEKVFKNIADDFYEQLAKKSDKLISYDSLREELKKYNAEKNLYYKLKRRQNETKL